MKEVFVDVVGTGWLLFLFFTILDVFNGFGITARIFFRWRDILWTFRYKGEPITVYFYGPPFDPIDAQDLLPFPARVHHRAGTDLVFETIIPALGVRGRLSVEYRSYGTVEYGSYGTTWCWGHEGEEVEALAVSRALA